MFSNPILLNRLDHWNRRLPPRRIEPNWTRVIPLLGDRGRRARKKDKHRKGRERRDPFHENQSVLVTLFGSAARPDHSLADFIGLGQRTLDTRPARLARAALASVRWPRRRRIVLEGNNAVARASTPPDSEPEDLTWEVSRAAATTWPPSGADRLPWTLPSSHRSLSHRLQHDERHDRGDNVENGGDHENRRPAAGPGRQHVAQRNQSAAVPFAVYKMP